jgi:hypothetical protein
MKIATSQDLSNKKQARFLMKKKQCLVLCKIVMFFACNLSISNVSAVGFDNLSPELKRELDTPGFKKGIDNFSSNDSESKIEELGKDIPISSEQDRDSAKFTSEYQGKDVMDLQTKAHAEQQSSENMKFLEKADGAGRSIDKNDPVFSKYNNALKNTTPSKDCAEILGTTGGEVEGGKDLPEFLEVEKTRQIPRTNFEVKSCEDKKNKYACTLTLKPKCMRQSKRTLGITNVISNDGTSISPSPYYMTTVSNHRNYSSYQVYFDIEDNVEVDEFTIERIRSNNALEIHFNSRKIYDGPSGFTYIKSGWFGSEHNSPIGEYAHNYVRKKSNNLYFKATKFGRFWVELSIKATVKVCQEWRDEWVEECTHQK